MSGAALNTQTTKPKWSEKTLGEVLELARNGVNVKQNKNGVGLPISRIETIAKANVNYDRVGFAELDEKQQEKFKLKSGDILFSHINSAIHVGKTALVRENRDLFHGVNLLLLRSGGDILPSFLNLYLSKIFDDGYWRKVCKQAVNQASVNQTDIRKITIPVPPLPEQERIVAILDEAFDRIAAATAQAKRNLHNARELFQSVLQSTFEQKGEDWVETTIGESCILKSGTSIKKNLELPNGDIPYVKVADMSFGGAERSIVSSSRFLDNKVVRESAVFPIGTTIFPKRGGAIATNKKRITEVPICADVNLMAVIPPKQIEPLFVYFYFLNVDMGKLGSGSSIPQINNYDISPLPFAFPKAIIAQKLIVQKLDALSAETRRLEAIYQRKLDALAELKQSLLQRAFAGEL